MSLPTGCDISWSNSYAIYWKLALLSHTKNLMHGSRGDMRSEPPPPGKSQSYRVPCQYRSGSHGKSLFSYQDSIQCWSSIRLPVKCHLNGVCGWAYNGPPLVVFWSSLSLSNKKKTVSELDPLWQNFLWWFNSIVQIRHLNPFVQIRHLFW